MDPNRKSIPMEALLALVAVILIIANLLGFSKNISNVSNGLFTPLISIGSQIGSNIKVVFETIPQINEIREERNELLVENAKLKAEIATYEFIKSELDLLKAEYKYDEDVTDSLSAKILSWGYGTIEGNLIVNKGEIENVHVGDVVTVGSIFIGSIEETSFSTSTVMLPTNIRSRVEVLIIPFNKSVSDITKDNLYSYIKNKNIKKWNAVALGDNGVINLENIPKNSSVKIGDHVIISDEKFPEYYYLGDISKVIYDPADVQIKAVVTQPYILNNLVNVFITRSSE